METPSQGPNSSVPNADPEHSWQSTLTVYHADAADTPSSPRRIEKEQSSFASSLSTGGTGSPGEYLTPGKHTLSFSSRACSIAWIA